MGLKNLSFSSFILYDQPVEIKLSPRAIWYIIFINRIKNNNSSIDEIKPISLNYQIKNAHGYSEEKEILFMDQGECCPVKLNFKIPASQILLSLTEKNEMIRIVLASTGNEKFSLLTPSRNISSNTSITKLSNELTRIHSSKFPVQTMSAILNMIYPDSFFYDNSYQFRKIPPTFSNLMNIAFKRIGKEAVLDEIIQLVNFIDLNITNTSTLSLGFGLFLLYVMNTYSETISYILPVSLGKTNYLYFLALFTFLNDRKLIKKIFSIPPSYKPYIDNEMLSVILSYVIRNQETIHFGILNLFSYISPQEEIELIFDDEMIIGVNKTMKLEISDSSDVISVNDNTKEVSLETQKCFDFQKSEKVKLSLTNQVQVDIQRLRPYGDLEKVELEPVFIKWKKENPTFVYTLMGVVPVFLSVVLYVLLRIN